MTLKGIQLPNDWGQDGLSGFFQGAYENSVLAFQKYRHVFNVLIDIDRLFNALQNIKFQNALIPNFVARSWFAWRAAVRLATSGQVVESYSVLRASLECALYGHFISLDERYTVVWLKRGTSEDATKQAKDLFTARAVKRAVDEKEKRLGVEVEQLYNVTIDYGGHPNVEGHITAAHWETGNLNIQDMICETLPWKISIQNCRDIGICDLHIFELMLGNRFCDAGLSKELETLCQHINKKRAGLV